MGWWQCCFRNEPAYKKVDADPAQYISASLESEYDVQSSGLKNTVSHLYRKVSDWYLPKEQNKVNLFTMNEEEHDFLLDEPGSAPYGSEIYDVEPENDDQHSRPRHTVSSIYDKVSDWSFPHKTNTKLSTVREGEHESLMDEYTPSSPCISCDGPSPSPSSPPQNLPDFGDVVDQLV